MMGIWVGLRIRLHIKDNEVDWKIEFFHFNKNILNQPAQYYHGSINKL